MLLFDSYKPMFHWFACLSRWYVVMKQCLHQCSRFITAPSGEKYKLQQVLIKGPLGQESCCSMLALWPLMTGLSNWATLKILCDLEDHIFYFKKMELNLKNSSECRLRVWTYGTVSRPALKNVITMNALFCIFPFRCNSLKATCLNMTLKC